MYIQTKHVPAHVLLYAVSCPRAIIDRLDIKVSTSFEAFQENLKNNNLDRLVALLLVGVSAVAVDEEPLGEDDRLRPGTTRAIAYFGGERLGAGGSL